MRGRARQGRVWGCRKLKGIIVRWSAKRTATPRPRLDPREAVEQGKASPARGSPARAPGQAGAPAAGPNFISVNYGREETGSGLSIRSKLAIILLLGRTVSSHSL